MKCDLSDIRRFVREYAYEHGGNLPSYREIALRFDIGSTNTVWYYMGQLIGAGELVRVDGKLCLTEIYQELKRSQEHSTS